MFRTFESFKYPIQLAEDSTIWRGIELVLNAPRLLITVQDEEDTCRTFMLNDNFDLLQFVETPGMGTLISARIVLPPDWSPSNDWEFVRICRVERELRSVEGVMPSAVLTSSDGLRYGGYPIAPVDRNDRDLSLLFDLSKAPQ